MKKSCRLTLGVLCAALFVLVATSVPAVTAVAKSNEPTLEEKEAPPQAPDVDDAAIWRQQVTCILNHPAEVQGYRITCTGASFLDARIADCCVAGDHWEAKVKNWDTAPNTAVATSPGGAGVFGPPARVYNYGGTAQNPNHVSAYLECSYLHGVDLFGAGSFIDLSSDGTCTVTADPVRARINRTP